MNLATEIVKLKIAAQVAPRRWQSSLHKLIIDLESGKEWEQALGRLTASQPNLGALLQAAGKAGQPAEITLDIIRQYNLGRIAWRRFISSLIYPLVLLFLALIVTSFVSMTFVRVIHDIQYGWMNMQNLNDRIRDLYHASLSGLVIVGWLAFFSLTVYLIAPPSARMKLLGAVPVIGRPYRWLALSEFLTRFAIFSRYQPVLDTALQLTAQSFGRNPLAAIARYVAKRTSEGEPFQNALHSTIVSDSRAGLALTLIERESLGPSSGLAARLLEQMVALTCSRLGLIMPPLVVFVFAAIVWGTWVSFVEIFGSILRGLV